MSERIRILNTVTMPHRGQIVYWMQAATRVTANHALEYAAALAAERRVPLHVIFIVVPGYPGAALRHWVPLLQGLADVRDALRERGIAFTVWVGEPVAMLEAISHKVNAIVTERAYVAPLVSWRDDLARRAACPVIEVDTNVVVPVAAASAKAEYSAATIRRKITPQIDAFAHEPSGVPSVPRPDAVLACPAAGRALPPEDLDAPEDLAGRLGLGGAPGPVTGFAGGERAALARLTRFLDEDFVVYAEARNFPDVDRTSRLSAYLHFGHISPIVILNAAREKAREVASTLPEMREAVESALGTLTEELVVRRELAINSAVYRPNYADYTVVPAWARKTLDDHRSDPRPAIYSAEELDAAATEDPYWNAAQRQMIESGYMHNYMRMYWGKKIIEWHSEPEEAFAYAISRNDRFELDGRDANGYAGVAWCFGLHDRPWQERPVFGMVRYMNAAGLKRKFRGIGQYVARWS